MAVLSLTMHPAADGDALMLTWGTRAESHHALIDLGRQGNFRKLAPRLAEIKTFELFVITHIDADHIAGAMPLMDAESAPFVPGEVWFNGREQLRGANRRLGREEFGALQGERFEAGIHKFGWLWNRRFESRVVSCDSPEARAPIEFSGGLKLRLLSPNDQKLAALAQDWDAEIAAAKLREKDKAEEDVAPPIPQGREHFGTSPDISALAAERFIADRTSANGSAIAFLAEFEGKRILLGADAHPDVLARSLTPLAKADGGRLKVDCFKISHHGSKANTSPELLALLDCTNFAYSTNGSRHQHPDAPAIARVLANDPKREKTLYFNSRHPQSEIWEDDHLKRRWKYTCVFPEKEGAPVTIEF